MNSSRYPTPTTEETRMQNKQYALLALAATLTSGFTVAQEQTGTLSYKASKDFSFVMPKEVWISLSSDTGTQPGALSWR